LRSTIHVPEYLIQLRNKAYYFIQRYQARNGSIPSDELIATEINRQTKNNKNPTEYTAEHIARAQGTNAYNGLSSLDITDLSLVPGEYSASSSSLNESLDVLVRKYLSPREQEIIRMRFGFGCEPMNLNDVGTKLGITRERVRQIQAKAVRKLGEINQVRLLESYLSDYT
jgi:RNA polymerase primary sigma factor